MTDHAAIQPLDDNPGDEFPVVPGEAQAIESHGGTEPLRLICLDWSTAARWEGGTNGQLG
ncbi:hypothetical protein [Intrasporangium sp.]|uniref:hypothetical protein n=1 Tax=Intrasporangium sp. TaxID=1925024 RepID=UPI00293B0708|nr:hypothetical protein [Intrasporangium sp.]MDV3221761.1 hypothetical protein [Intrasporangium sp.]